MTDRPHSLLIVDDEAVLRNAIAFDFKRKGYNVVTAANGEEALARFESQAFDVILTDVRMPGIDGVELLKQVKKLSPKIPVVIFITGFADITTEEAYALGAHAVFAKPFDRKALFEAVQKAVDGIDAVWRSRPERVRADLEIKLAFPDPETAIASRLLNIGTGGFFVKLAPANLPEVGTHIPFLIRFEASQNGPLVIQGTGIVRWKRTQDTTERPSGCGVEFASLDDSSRRRVTQLLQSLNPSAFIPRD